MKVCPNAEFYFNISTAAALDYYYKIDSPILSIQCVLENM